MWRFRFSEEDVGATTRIGGNAPQELAPLAEPDGVVPGSQLRIRGYGRAHGGHLVVDVAEVAVLGVCSLREVGVGRKNVGTPCDGASGEREWREQV